MAKRSWRSGANIPQNHRNREYGQINSSFSDNRIVISQDIRFPTVYTNQKAALKEEWKKQHALWPSRRRTEEGSQATIPVGPPVAKEKAVAENDSLYSAFGGKQVCASRQGKATSWKKATAETQRGQIVVQLDQLQTDLDVLQARFQLLLNTTTLPVPHNDFKAAA